MIETDIKLVLALSRIAHAFQVLLRNETKISTSSPIQAQILIFLLSHPHLQNTITSIAQEFDLSKPTVSESVKSLLEKLLIEKIENCDDSRRGIIILTEKGRQMALATSDFLLPFQVGVSTLPEGQKSAMFDGLLNLIYELHQTNTIIVQRMCYTCNHYSKEGDKHFCQFLRSTLENHQLQLDCEDHVRFS